MIVKGSVTGHAQSLSDEGIARVRAVLRFEGSLRNQVLFNVQLETGLRSSDLLALSVGAVLNLDGSVKSSIIVKQIKIGGTKKSRPTTPRPIYPATRVMIAELVRGKDRADPLFSAQGRNAWIVYSHVRTNGQTYTVRAGMSYEQHRLLWKKWTELAGLVGHFATHTARRTHAKKVYVASGRCMATVQAALGHAHSTSTDTYLRPELAEMDDLYARITF